MILCAGALVPRIKKTEAAKRNLTRDFIEAPSGNCLYDV
jgi:hypothetical protein